MGDLRRDELNSLLVDLKNWECAAFPYVRQLPKGKKEVGKPKKYESKGKKEKIAYFWLVSWNYNSCLLLINSWNISRILTFQQFCVYLGGVAGVYIFLCWGFFLVLGGVVCVFRGVDVVVSGVFAVFLFWLLQLLWGVGCSSKKLHFHLSESIR